MSGDEEAGVVQALRTYPDVQAVRLRHGQVLHYPGHYPLGIWVVLSGRLRLTPDDRVLDTDAGPMLLPALTDLDRPAVQGVVVERAATALFVPHSVAADDGAVRRLLERLSPQAVREVR